MKAPAWLEPDADEVPVAVPLMRVLAQADGAVLVLRRADVYSEGVRFVVGVHMRLPANATKEERERMRRVAHDYGFGMSGRGLSGELRLGVELPGGATADTLSRSNIEWDREPEGPSLVSRGGGGGGDEHRWDSRLDAWLWPLPPAGRATLHFVFEGLGIEEGSFEFDTEPLLEAARGVIRLY